MNLLSWWINMGGIIVSLIGSIYAYKGAPRDSIGIEDRSGYPYSDKQVDEMFKGYSNRQKFSRQGFLLLTVGFVILGIAQILVYPA